MNLRKHFSKVHTFVSGGCHIATTSLGRSTAVEKWNSSKQEPENRGQGHSSKGTRICKDDHTIVLPLE